MAKGASKLIVVALVGAGLWGAYGIGKRLFSGDEIDAERTRHVVNQVWIERMPESQRDMIGHFVLLDHREGKFGAFGKSSQWRHFVEVFMWKMSGSQLSLYFPQEEMRAKVKVRTWQCEGEAPEPFQLCLEISNGRRSMTYYSREDWRIEPHDAAASLAELADDEPALAAIVAPDAIEDIDLDLEDFTEIDRFPLAD